MASSLCRVKLLHRHLPLLLSSQLENRLIDQLCKRCNTLSAANQDVFVGPKKRSQRFDAGTSNATGDRQHQARSQNLSEFVSSREKDPKGAQKQRRDPKKSLQQFNDENKYIRNHVSKKLVDFSKLGAMIDSQSIKSLLDELDNFTKTEHSDESVYKEARSELFKKFKLAIREMSLQELAICLTYIKDSEVSEFRVIKKMIDVSLTSRLRYSNRKISTNDLNILLYIADLFYQFKGFTTFASELIKKDQLSLDDKQLMYMLFLIILEREDYGLLSRHEGHISRLLEKPTFEDLSTICMGYFKTRSVVKNSTILKKMLDRALELLPSMDYEQPGYCAIIKCIRYSRDSSLRESVSSLITKVTRDPSCSKALDSLYNLIQTAKLVENYRIYNPQLLDRLGECIARRDEFRIKDIQYALTTLSNSRWNDLRLDDSLRHNFGLLCQSIVSENRPDATYQQTHLLPFLRSFLVYGYYNDDFINYISSSLNDNEKANQMRATVLDFDKSLLLGYAATRIESDGAKLQGSESFLSEVSRSIKRVGSEGSVKKDSSISHLSFLLHPKLSNVMFQFSGQMRSISKSLLTMDGLDSPEIHHGFQFTMAHQNYADLVISLERPAPGSFDPETLMPRQIAANEKHCLVFAVQNNDFMDGCDRLSGFKAMIMRLLIRVGYRVVVVNLDKPDIVQLSREIRSVLRDQDI